MRVAAVGYPLLVERQWALFPEFASRGVETHLLVPKEWADAPDADRPPADAEFTVHSHRALFQDRQGAYLLPGAAATLREIDPDVVFVHGEPWDLNTLFVAGVCRALSTPCAVFTWENLDRVPESGIQQTVERLTHRLVSGIVAGTEDARDRIRAAGFQTPVTVAPQTGVDTERFAPSAADDAALERLGVDPSGPVVLYTGRLAPEKGLDTLLETVPTVAERHPDVTYLLVGDGPENAALRERIEREGLGGTVVLIDERQPYELMPAIVASSTVFVYPSETTADWAEQFGYSVVEAMSCGVPPVVSDCGSLPSVVDDAGVVFPEADADALGTEIADLLADDERYERLSRASRERVERSFGLSAVAEAQLDFLGGLVDRTARSEVEHS
ncbi:MAG: glycosyltransferase family 4 protein [Halobaculum sp.]